MKARESSASDWSPSPRFCLCDSCGKLHSNCPCEMSMVEDIIAEVKQRPELWLSKHPKFNHFKLKGQLWKEIAAKLNLEGDILKKHWRYLRGQFKKELAKPSRDGGDQPGSTWQYFDLLSFLREEFEECQSEVQTSFIREEVLVSGDLPMSIGMENEFGHSFNDLPCSTQLETSETRSIFSPAQDFQEDNSSTQPIPSMPSATLRSRRSVDSQPIMNSMVKPEYMKSQIMMAEMFGNNDDDFFYLMSILPTMKRLTSVQKMRFRSKIEQFLLEAVTVNEHSSYINNFSPNHSLSAKPNRKRTSRQNLN